MLILTLEKNLVGKHIYLSPEAESGSDDDLLPKQSSFQRRQKSEFLAHCPMVPHTKRSFTAHRKSPMDLSHKVKLESRKKYFGMTPFWAETGTCLFISLTALPSSLPSRFSDPTRLCFILAKIQSVSSKFYISPFQTKYRILFCGVSLYKALKRQVSQKISWN